MIVQVNGGTLAVTHKGTVPRYRKYFWFSRHAITNIISLKTLIEQYQMTYDSIDYIYLVHT